MATKGKKDNRLKRKRGKKFRHVEGEPKGAKAVPDRNPFENHSASRKA